MNKPLWIQLSDTYLDANHIIGWSTAPIPATHVSGEGFILAVFLDTLAQPLAITYDDVAKGMADAEFLAEFVTHKRN